MTEKGIEKKLVATPELSVGIPVLPHRNLRIPLNFFRTYAFERKI